MSLLCAASRRTPTSPPATGRAEQQFRQSCLGRKWRSSRTQRQVDPCSRPADDQPRTPARLPRRPLPLKPAHRVSEAHGGAAGTHLGYRTGRLIKVESRQVRCSVYFLRRSVDADRSTTRPPHVDRRAPYSVTPKPNQFRRVQTWARTPPSSDATVVIE